MPYLVHDHFREHPTCGASHSDGLGSERDDQAGIPKLGLYPAWGEPRSEPAIAGPLEPGTQHMAPDDPFPLNLFPAQVRAAILSEFDGRCPSLQEVAEISDARWLSTPAIGPVVLKKIRDLGQGDAAPSRLMTDAELLRRLTLLQKEVQLIQRTVRRMLPQGSRGESPLHRGSLSTSTRSLLPSEASLPSRTSNGGEAPFSL